LVYGDLKRLIALGSARHLGLNELLPAGAAWVSRALIHMRRFSAAVGGCLAKTIQVVGMPVWSQPVQ
jgi:hypothetical protein